MSDNHQTSEDLFFQALVDAGMPAADEMAAEEHALRALQSAPRTGETTGRLPAGEVERLTARAVGVAPAAGVMLAMARGPKRMLLAAMLLVSVASIAWFGTNIVWPGQQNSTGHLDFAKAVQLVVDPTRSDEARVSAMALLVEHCEYAVASVSQLSREQTVPTVANRAREIQADWLLTLESGPLVPPAVVDLGVELLVVDAIDGKLPVQQRLRALDSLHALVTSGLRAMLYAPLVGAEASESRRLWVERLLKALRGG